MRAVFGLGNPGKRYHGTRHNVGFEVVDRLAAGADARVTRRRFAARVGEADTRAGRLLLVKPQTFMNDSGLAVQAAVAWYKLDPADILVVCDDLDLELGKIRIRRKGSSGGHKGLKSIARALGTPEYARLRIGIGRPGHQDAVDYVLDSFSAAQRRAMTDAIQVAAEAVICWAEEGVEPCMNQFN